MDVGYCRVSTPDQRLDLQEDALKKAGCKKIFSDVGSGKDFNRPGLKSALDFMREGDSLTVWRLDRLGRSLVELIRTVNDINEKKMGFKSLQENISTTSSTGKMIFQLFSVLAEYERNLTIDRTMAGLAAARARGRFGGRPKLLDRNKIKLAKTLAADKNNSVKTIYETLGVSKATLYRALREAC